MLGKNVNVYLRNVLNFSFSVQKKLKRTRISTLDLLEMKKELEHIDAKLKCIEEENVTEQEKKGSSSTESD